MNRNKNRHNILNAFFNIIQNPEATVNPTEIISNRINNVGDALEYYIKDAIDRNIRSVFDF